MTWEEYEAKIAAGEMTEAEALDAFLREGLAQPVTTNVMDLISSNVQERADNILNTVPYIHNTASAEKQALEAIANADPSLVKPELQEEAKEELALRSELQEGSFLDQLTNPKGFGRLARSALKGPAQTVNAVTNLIPGLVAGGMGYLTDDEAWAAAQEELFRAGGEMNQQINDRFGSSDPVNAAESLAEAASGVLVPGGVLAKTAGVMTDFGADQTIRELTDDEGADYDTVFDLAGVEEGPQVSPMLAVPAIAAATVLGAGAVSTLRRQQVVKPPVLRDVSDLDPGGPSNLKTLERSSDELYASVVDAQSAITRVVKRAGFPDINSLDQRISLDTGSAAGIRIREGMRNGVFAANGKTYKTNVPVQTLHNAYRQLPPDVRKNVADYINIQDQLDDARIALNKGDPSAQQTIYRLQAVGAQIARDFPIAKDFQGSYADAMRGVRDFLEGDIFSSKRRLQLDQERPHYVPLTKSSIDPNAPVMLRLRQAASEGGVRPEDRFTLTRESLGDLDYTQRVDPFDALFEYTEDSLRFGLNNSTRTAVVEALENSQFGRETIRKVTKNDDLDAISTRVVEVYRNGTREQYVTSQLMADLLRFDPYVAKHPGWFLPKRLFEYNAVGPASITFAPISAIRDVIGGNVIAANRNAVAGPLSTAAAIPQQLWAKANRAVAANLEAGIASNNSAIPYSIWPKSSRQGLAQGMSDRYMNSTYHRAQTAGGIDASEMRNNIEVAKTTFGELSRTVRETADNNAVTRLVKDYGYKPVANIIDAFASLYGSVMDAPRLAAFQKGIRAGLSDQDAGLAARDLVGDTSRSGRTYRSDGTKITSDAVDTGVGSLLVGPTTRAGQFVKESAPFVNPMIQGNRRLIASFRDDPVGTTTRAWLTVGLPATLAYSWNEMLGQEYNDYAVERRSGYDLAMRIYFGLPGKPPEEGLELDIPHELTMFNSPYTYAMHMLNRGTDKAELNFGMTQLAKTISANTLSLGTPPLAAATADLAGFSLPDGLSMAGVDGAAYAPREDYIGVVPTNIENMLRELFASNANTALQVAAVMAGEDETSWTDMLDTVYNDVARRTPVLRNVTGRKSANVSFSLPAELEYQKANAVDTLWDYWREHFEGDYYSDAGLQHTYRGDEFDPYLTEPKREGMPARFIGPEQVPVAVNPLVPYFATTLVDAMRRGDYNKIDKRDSAYRSYVKRLRDYNNGHKNDFAEWQERVEALDIDDPNIAAEDVRVVQLLKDHDIDLTQFRDRTKLINMLENERSFIIQEKLTLARAAEEEITQRLLEVGLIKPGEQFLIERDADPMKESPLGLTKEQVEQALGDSGNDPLGIIFR